LSRCCQVAMLILGVRAVGHRRPALADAISGRRSVCQTCRAMRRLNRLSLITLAAIACCAAPAVARVSGRDTATTHAYLEARIALQRAMAAAGTAELDAIRTLEAQVKAECPGVLAGAPPQVKGEKTNESERKASEELASVVFGAGEHIGYQADARFARTARRLRWSNAKLTRLLRSLAIEQAEQSAIPPPNLCADMKFWVASGYAAVSDGTKRFVRRHEVVASITLIESEPNEPASNFLNLDALVAYRLRPYENHADRLLARKALPPGAKITDPRLRPFFEAVVRVYAALGRTPTLGA
jgi:hypothetical protein